MVDDEVLLNKKEVEEIRIELEESKFPLFFYDDDPDGLCSFIILYKMHREGHGFIVKSLPKIEAKSLRSVEEKNPDKIFILDMPMVEKEFIDGAKRKIVWIDHHPPSKLLDNNEVKYYNPRLKDPKAYLPTTRMAYQINPNPENLWLAFAGCLGDWHLPDFTNEFIEKYPQLLSKNKSSNTNEIIEDAMFHQPIGKLVRIFSFLLKGPTSEISKSVRILIRIKGPMEILEQTTPQGKYLYKRYLPIEKEYLKLLEEAKKSVTKSKVLVFTYMTEKFSFTSELSTELGNLYPEKTIIVCRKKSGEMKCSLRSRSNIARPLEKALVGINGYGGGHEVACGAVVKEEDWEQFLKQFKEEFKKV